MRLTRTLQIVTVLLTALFVAGAVFVALLLRQFNTETTWAEQADAVAVHVLQRRLFADEYAAHPLARAAHQWSLEQAELVRLANQTDASGPAAALVARLSGDTQAAGDLFGQIVALFGSSAPRTASFAEKENRLIGQLDIRAQDSIDAADQLAELDRAVAHQVLSGIVTTFAALAGLFFLALLLCLQVVRRSAARLQATRARSEAILGSIGDGVFAIDQNRDIILFNQAAAEITGVAGTEALGHPYAALLRFLDERTGATVDGFIETALSGKRARMPERVVLVGREGALIPVTDTAAPIMDAGGKITGAVVVFRDETDQRAIERTKAEFVSLASHELKSPAGVINWSADLLLTKNVDGLNEAQRGLIKVMGGAAHKLQQVITGLLNASRVDLDTLIVEPVSADFAGLVRSTVLTYTQDIGLKRLQLQEAYPADLPEMPLDPELIRIMVDNLLSNAIKYTPAGGHVSVSVTRDGKVVTLQVRDDGCGIPADARKRIFTKMFRADNVKKMADGSGFGLYLTKAVAELAGGRIWFESEEGKGSTFFVELPLSGMVKREGTSKLQPLV